jgi:hypothetical protein
MRQPLLIYAVVSLLASTQVGAMDARDHAAQAGLGPIREGEVRHLLLKADDPDEGGSDACRRVDVVDSLLWSAARRHEEQDK